MKNIQFLSIIAITFLMGLIYLIVTLQNPLDQKYNEIIQRIMEEKELLTENEAIVKYPKLNGLKIQIQVIKKMRSNIEQISRHPIPPNKEQSLQLLSQIKKVKVMNENVILQMAQISNRILMNKTVAVRTKN